MSELNQKVTSQRMSLEFKSTDEHEGRVTGFGAYYNNIDRDDDIILPGAFAESIIEHKSGARMIPLLEEHNNNNIWSANIDEINEGENGLEINTLVSENRKPEFKNLISKQGLSVGYISTKSHRTSIQGKDVRVIEKARLVEISATSNPANLLARAEFKSADSKEQQPTFKDLVEAHFLERKSIKGVQSAIELMLKSHDMQSITHSERKYFTDKVLSSLEGIISQENKSQEASAEVEVPSKEQEDFNLEDFKSKINNIKI